MFIQLIKLIRPKQWIKNFFVFAPLLFSRHIFHLEYLIPSLAAFFIFSGAAFAQQFRFGLTATPVFDWLSVDGTAIENGIIHIEDGHLMKTR